MTATMDQIDYPLTHNEMIDHDHAEFVELLSGFQALTDAELSPALESVIEHFKAHFAREEALMEETGFPPTMIHKNEHRRVLDWAGAMRAEAKAGNVAILRKFLTEEIADWFVNHAATMDTATANWAAGKGLRI